MQTLLCEVNRSHAGQPWSLVDAHLRQRFVEGGLTPKEPAFSEFVDLIAQGKFRLRREAGQPLQPLQPHD
jgi:hypothetical protein